MLSSRYLLMGVTASCRHSRGASLLTRLHSAICVPWESHFCRRTISFQQYHLKSPSYLHVVPNEVYASRNSLIRTHSTLFPRSSWQTLNGRHKNLRSVCLGQFRIENGQCKPLCHNQQLRTLSFLQSFKRLNGLEKGGPFNGYLSHRCMSTIRNGQQQAAWRQRNKSVMLYIVAGAVLVVGFSYAAVPLYTVFCQATGLGGQATLGHDTEKVEHMSAVAERELTVRFNADTAASMRWNFRPQQTEIKLVPGETALAFYSAMNPTDKPIVGISTYNVVPFDAGQYFNKIQCFCFEEQRLNPHEQVDMPVFFYIDPDFADDPKMEKVNSITLSYTFFESKEGLELPDPWSRS